MLYALPSAIWYLSGWAREVVAYQVNALSDHDGWNVQTLKQAVA